MSSRCRDRVVASLLLAALLLFASAATAQAAPPLRVCADPDNPPYSERTTAERTTAPHAASGFEVRIAEELAQALGRPLEVHWQPLQRGFVRKTLGEGLCDVLIGVPAGFERVVTTRPYYRSTYVFVTRRDERKPLRDFDDPRLPRLRIGVQLPGDDLAATPPGHALARHGAIERVVGYTPYGDVPSAQRMLDVLRAGRLDAALVWGPQAGWFAATGHPALQVTPARTPADVDQPFDFAIALGVRRGNTALRDALQSALDSRREAIEAILDAYHVPRVALARPTP